MPVISFILQQNDTLQIFFPHVTQLKLPMSPVYVFCCLFLALQLLWKIAAYFFESSWRSVVDLATNTGTTHTIFCHV